jgi:hypothetical protein
MNASSISRTLSCLSVLILAGPAGAQPAAVPASPEDGGNRYWEVQSSLNLRERPSTSARIVDSYAAGTILNNLGCERGEHRAWCYVQELGGGPVGYVAADYIERAVSPNGAVMRGTDDSALRAGRGDFDATGSLPCASESGQPMRQCEFGVARAGGGDATVVVTRPDGRKRAIFFQFGRATSADMSEADYAGEFRVERDSDLNLIRVGRERYEIPDAVPLGG